MSSAVALCIAAGAATALWFVLLAVMAVRTRSPEPEVRPAGLELGGDEAPAVVNLLASGWKLSPSALPATLVDLAARGVVRFEERADGELVVRVDVAEPPAELAPYERLVLDHVRGLAIDGVVPCDALTTGPQDSSTAWWGKFTKAVIDDARQRGLSRARWSPLANTLLWLSSAVPGALVATAVLAVGEGPGSDDPGVVVALFAGFVLWALLVSAWATLREERSTDEGLVVAGRWLGLAENLRADPVFGTHGPGAIAIWDRHLAYGAALGAAPATVEAVPMGAESDTEAWSSVGGRWRLVRVRYPRFSRPGWGRPPWLNTVIGLGVTGFALFVIWLVTDLGDGSPVTRVVVVLMALVLARGVWLLGVSAPDLGRHRAVTGRVLRWRRRKVGKDSWVTYVAVDDGSSDNLDAWLAIKDPQGIAQGDWVTLDVTPRCGFVRSIGTTPPPH